MDIFYNIVAQKYKVIQIEDVALNFYPTRQNANVYTEEDNNCGGDSSAIILDD